MLWYNTGRVHQALDGRTPDEAWNGIEPDEPIPIRAADQTLHTHISVQRSSFQNDASLPMFDVKMTQHAA